jgi:hypothetical protein
LYLRAKDLKPWEDYVREMAQKVEEIFNSEKM